MVSLTAFLRGIHAQLSLHKGDRTCQTLINSMSKEIAIDQY